MIPLIDLGPAHYLGFPGGLYPDGKNSRPTAHEEAGIALAATVKPLDRDGEASPSGKVGMLCIGMSNASREFTQLIRLAETDPRKNHSLVMINAALNGADATQLVEPGGSYWQYVELKLQRCAVTSAQVQIVWLKTALAHQPPAFPEKAHLLQSALRSIVENLRTKFPQLTIIYLSSRTYGGYSETGLSTEPIAYESAFAVKWLIEEHLTARLHDRSIPWVSWGPYLWANGLMPRKDGLCWVPSDFESDGAHPSTQGALKVATILLRFFESDATAQPWFFSKSTLCHLVAPVATS